MPLVLVGVDTSLLGDEVVALHLLLGEEVVASGGSRGLGGLQPPYALPRPMNG
jgi:hypothetical protein